MPPMATGTAPPPNTASAQPPDDPFAETRMSFGDHLEELRRRLIYALAGAFVAVLITLALGKPILAVIYRPLLVVQYAEGLPPSIQVLAPTSAFAAYLKIGILSGLILSAPWGFYQLWAFVAAGLYPHERRFVMRLVPVSAVLFVIGVLFLYYVVLPIVLHFFIRFNKTFGLPDLTPSAFQRLLLADGTGDGAESPASIRLGPGGPRVAVVTKDPQAPPEGAIWFNRVTRRLMIKDAEGQWSVPLERTDRIATMDSRFAIDFYISFVLMLALGFGIAFETPLLVFFLAWSGLVTRAEMARGRRYVLLTVVILAAVLTPPDVVSQLLLAMPMYILFELGLAAARMVERPAASAERTD
ncbi:MAG: preprotein translocase subunit TatC [Planctomycetota bacterium]|nr:MAG: preprotein translocase subunit TatC [Planctomycetota bacterium]